MDFARRRHTVSLLRNVRLQAPYSGASALFLESAPASNTAPMMTAPPMHSLAYSGSPTIKNAHSAVHIGVLAKMGCAAVPHVPPAPASEPLVATSPTAYGRYLPR